MKKCKKGHSMTKIFPESTISSPSTLVECLRQTFASDEARREHYLKLFHF